MLLLLHCRNSLCIVDINPLSNTICKYSLPCCGLPFHSVNSTVFFFFNIFLKYNWFTALCQFLLHSIVTQSYVYIFFFLYYLPADVVQFVFVVIVIACTFGVIFMKSLPNPMSCSFPLCFLLRVL